MFVQDVPCWQQVLTMIARMCLLKMLPLASLKESDIPASPRADLDCVSLWQQVQHPAPSVLTLGSCSV